MNAAPAEVFVVFHPDSRALVQVYDDVDEAQECADSHNHRFAGICHVVRYILASTAAVIRPGSLAPSDWGEEPG